MVFQHIDWKKPVLREEAAANLSKHLGFEQSDVEQTKTRCRFVTPSWLQHLQRFFEGSVFIIYTYSFYIFLTLN